MEQPIMGQISLVGFNFAPRGWAFCHGQLLPVNEFNALFSLLGTNYGGDGRNTFALPDLRGRVAVSAGNGPGLSNNYNLGQRGGQETVTLYVNQIPSHTHGTSTAIGTGVSASESAIVQNAVSKKEDNTSVVTVSSTGGNQAHENRQPYCVLNYVIALEGLYPSRS